MLTLLLVAQKQWLMKDIKKNHEVQLWISCAIHTGVFRMDI